MPIPVGSYMLVPTAHNSGYYNRCVSSDTADKEEFCWSSSEFLHHVVVEC